MVIIDLHTPHATRAHLHQAPVECLTFPKAWLNLKLAKLTRATLLRTHFIPPYTPTAVSMYNGMAD
jgi:hypothetical protein